MFTSFHSSCPTLGRYCNLSVHKQLCTIDVWYSEPLLLSSFCEVLNPSFPGMAHWPLGSQFPVAVVPSFWVAWVNQVPDKLILSWLSFNDCQLHKFFNGSSHLVLVYHHSCPLINQRTHISAAWTQLLVGTVSAQHSHSYRWSGHSLLL